MRDIEEPKEPTSRSQVGHSNPTVYDLRGLTEGSDDGVRCLPPHQTDELGSIFAQVQVSADLEYPAARDLVGGTDIERFIVASGGREADLRTVNQVDRSPSSISPRQRRRSSEQANDGRLTNLAGGCAIGLISLAVVVGAAAAVDGSVGLLLASAAVALVSLAVTVALILRSRGTDTTAAARSRARLRRVRPELGPPPQGPPSALGLRESGDLRETLRVGIRTAGLGLLIRPASAADADARNPGGDRPGDDASRDSADLPE